MWWSKCCGTPPWLFKALGGGLALSSVSYAITSWEKSLATSPIEIWASPWVVMKIREYDLEDKRTWRSANGENRLPWKANIEQDFLITSQDGELTPIYETNWKNRPTSTWFYWKVPMWKMWCRRNAQGLLRRCLFPQLSYPRLEMQNMRGEYEQSWRCKSRSQNKIRWAWSYLAANKPKKI